MLVVPYQIGAGLVVAGAPLIVLWSLRGNRDHLYVGAGFAVLGVLALWGYNALLY